MILILSEERPARISPIMITFGCFSDPITDGYFMGNNNQERNKSDISEVFHLYDIIRFCIHISGSASELATPNSIAP